ncbi:MAG: DsbA family oxidoreductase [Alphaproteobacteria bacterium]|nr:DsbA family oxidoreductase [Alphaproteobacteria bacterium]
MNGIPVRIDFVADLCCPWCYVSWRALDVAISAHPDVTFERRWGAFLLRPDTPKEGFGRKAYLDKLFAGQPERALASRAALQVAADDAGAPLDLDAAKTLPNTMNAHRLIEWATGQSRLEQMVDALFVAYFVDGRDIGDDGVLCDIAAEQGLDRTIVVELLAGEQDWAHVADAHNAAVNAGVRGVPVVIFNQKFARQGAESVAAYTRCLQAAL